MREENTSVISNEAEASFPAICKQELGPALRPGAPKVRKDGHDPAPVPSRSLPQGRPGEADRRRDRARSSAGRKPYGRTLRLPEWGWSGPSLRKFPAVTPTFLHLLQPPALCPTGTRWAPVPPGQTPVGGRLTEQRAYEDDDLHGGGEVAVQLRLAQLPESAAVGARRLGARRVARLAGVPGDPAAVVPHGEAGAPALLAARPPARLEPRVSLSRPGRRGTRGCREESWRTRGSLGSPHDSTSPAPAPRRRGGRKARRRPMPAPSWVPSAPTGRRHGQSPPSVVRPSPRVVSAAQPTQRRGKHSRRHGMAKGGNSPLSPPTPTSAPSTPPRVGASLSSRLG